jgi:hypothetical protein
MPQTPDHRHFIEAPSWRVDVMAGFVAKVASKPELPKQLCSMTFRPCDDCDREQREHEIGANHRARGSAHVHRCPFQ